MDQGNSAGLLATIGSAIGTIGIAGVAIWKAYATLFERERNRAEMADADAVRAHLDRAQANYINRIERENKRLRDERELWEGRARRVDQVAYTLRRLLVAAYAQLGRAEADIPKIPLLEEEL